MYRNKLPLVGIKRDLYNRIQKYNIKGGWYKSNNTIREFKEIVKEKLTDNQKGLCAYCELPLAARSPETEHIAPQTIYPQTSFNMRNLVRACHRCNSSECKWVYDTVQVNHGKYNDWKFKIVHPYFDDPKAFFDYDESNCILRIKEGLSDEQHKKADNTIKIFKLDSEAMLDERMGAYLLKQHKLREAGLIEEISTYKE